MVILSILMLFTISPPLITFQQEKNLLNLNSEFPNSIFKWDVESVEKGVMMFLDVPFRKNSNDSIEYLTIAVAISKNNKKPDFISFIVPANVKKGNGIFLKFSKQDKTGNELFQLETRSVRVHFTLNNTTDYTFTARIFDGSVVNGTRREIEDIFVKFLQLDFLFILLTYPNETHKTIMIPLYTFQKQYRTL